MCGRFFQDLDEREVRAQFRAEGSPRPGSGAPVGRYNIGPGQAIWVVRTRPDTHQRSLDALHWGLIPHFAPDRKGAYRMINARAETIDRTPAFRSAFARRRCLVPARGFFEWRREGKHKQPFAIAPADGGLLAFAGLWENWRDETTGEWVRSVAIVTTDANATLRPLHDRMPVIVAPEDHARWLGEEPADAVALKQILHPYQHALKVWPVSPRMNRAQVDEAANLEPVQLELPATDPRPG